MSSRLPIAFRMFFSSRLLLLTASSGRLFIWMSKLNLYLMLSLERQMNINCEMKKQQHSDWPMRTIPILLFSVHNDFHFEGDASLSLHRPLRLRRDHCEKYAYELTVCVWHHAHHVNYIAESAAPRCTSNLDARLKCSHGRLLLFIITCVFELSLSCNESPYPHGLNTKVSSRKDDNNNLTV